MTSFDFFISPRRRFLRLPLVLLGASALHTVPARAQPKGSDEAAALATVVKFRFLSQRLAKAYAGMMMDGTLNADSGRSKAVLESSKELLNRHSADLGKLANVPPHIRKQLDDVTQQAAALIAKTAETPTKERLQAFNQSANQLLKTANEAAQTLEKLIAQPAARLVNLSGSQRFLSQRIAKNHFLKAAAIDAASAAAEIDTDLATFKTNLATLKAAPISTPAIKAELEQAQAQLLFFEGALKKPPELTTLRDVLSTSERLLEVMDKLTGMYEAALRAVM